MPVRRESPRRAARMLPPGRAFIDELDSVEQSRIFAAESSQAEAERGFVAMIRTTVLLSGTLLVTDSMLLDGAFFLSVGPDGLAHRLGVATHELPLTIITGEDTLRTTLDAKLGSADFVWQLRGQPLFREGSEEWPYARVRAGWDAWIAAAANGRVGVENRNAPGQAPRPAFALSLDTGADELAGLAPTATALLMESRSLDRRSDFMRRHDEMAADNPEAVHDLGRVLHWWNDAYLDALARTNGASWIRFSMRSDRTPAVAGPPGMQRRRLQLSGTMVDTMRVVPPPVYGTLLYVLRAERREFRNKPGRATLNAIAYGVTEQTTHAGRRSVLRGSALRFALALGALTASLPFIPGRWSGIETAWAAFALLALTTVPWRELTTLYQTSHRNLSGVISVSVDSR